ncbi:MAG: hypothetical protein ACI89L_002774 [Phycisphaerales bacterium]|jgi:uncharacterized protein (TIGR03382 family)
MKSVLAFAAVAGLATAAHADIIISEVVDATLPGGNPKFVELTNTGAADVTFGVGDGIINQSNASLDYIIDVDLNGVTIAAGASYVIQSAGNDGQLVFESTYGFAADLYTAAFFSNGDDRYGLWMGGALHDMHGTDGVDGTGSAWEYLDGFAFSRENRITANGGVFNVNKWVSGGVNSLESATFNDVAELGLILARTTPGTHVFNVPTPGAAALLGLGGLVATRRRRA